MEDLRRCSRGGDKIEPSSGIDLIRGYREDLQRERILVPETIKKPSVEVLLLDGLLYPVDF